MKPRAASTRAVVGGALMVVPFLVVAASPLNDQLRPPFLYTIGETIGHP